MKENNDNLKKILQSKMLRINDDSFTDRIVKIHLAKKQEVKSRPFINFMSLIIGLSAVIVSIGLVILLRQNNEWINEIGLNEQHGLILFVLSIMFLIYKWIEEFTAPSNVYSSLAG